MEQLQRDLVTKYATAASRAIPPSQRRVLGSVGEALALQATGIHRSALVVQSQTRHFSAFATSRCHSVQRYFGSCKEQTSAARILSFIKNY